MLSMHNKMTFSPSTSMFARTPAFYLYYVNTNATCIRLLKKTVLITDLNLKMYFQISIIVNPFQPKTNFLQSKLNIADVN